MQNLFLLFLTSILLLTSCCGPSKLRLNPNPDPFPPFHIPQKIRVALVLGSGGVRGMAHIGVLEELHTAGIPIDLIVGCSAGSIAGALYADQACIESAKSAVWHIKTNSILDFEIASCRFGFCRGTALRKILGSYLYATTFEELQIPLVIVSSDLHTGELITIGSGPLIPAIQASCSIPFVFVPCQYNGRILVDGGVINPVPVKVARDLGADLIIAVDLCELLDKTFPTNLFGVANRSAEIAFMWQNQACTRDADVVIRPRTCGIGTFDDTKKRALYEAGKRAAREQLPLIKHLTANLSRDPCCEWILFQPECYTPQIYHESFQTQ